jgi:hypothetical protein
MLKASFIVAVVAFLILPVAAQQPARTPPQTARQALIEMMTGGDKGFTKHLTVEVQRALEQRTELRVGSPVQLWSSMALGATRDMRTFDSGQLLLAFTDAGGNRKFEIHVDGDDLSGDEDNLDLSVHTFVDGQEQSAEGLSELSLSRFAVNMKRQQSVWRLNRITISVGLSIGDPAFLEQILGQGGAKTAGTAAGNESFLPEPHTELRVTPVEEESALPITAPDQLVALLAYAEREFARLHPDQGFTCSLADLAESANVKMDPKVSTGTYYNYHYSLSGCEGKPTGSFQLTAEPVAAGAGGRAFCTDATQNVRVSEDGRAATCLVAGTVPRDADAENGVAGVHLVKHNTK